MHPMETNRRIQDGALRPTHQSDWVYAETPSGQKATNMRTGEVWHMWESDRLYHPGREPRKSSTDSILALILYACIIIAAVVVVCIGVALGISMVTP